MEMQPLPRYLSDSARSGIPHPRQSSTSPHPIQTLPSTPSHAYLLHSFGPLQFHQVETTNLPACRRGSTAPSDRIFEGPNYGTAEPPQPNNEHNNDHFYGNPRNISYAIIDANALQNLVDVQKQSLMSCIQEALEDHDKRRKEYQELHEKEAHWAKRVLSNILYFSEKYSKGPFAAWSSIAGAVSLKICPALLWNWPWSSFWSLSTALWSFIWAVPIMFITWWTVRVCKEATKTNTGTRTGFRTPNPQSLENGTGWQCPEFPRSYRRAF